MKGSARGKWDLREGQQPFRLNQNEAGDRTTTLRRLLIGAAVYKVIGEDLQSVETFALPKPAFVQKCFGVTSTVDTVNFLTNREDCLKLVFLMTQQTKNQAL